MPLLLVLSACTPPGDAFWGQRAAVALSADAVDFGEVAHGATATAELGIENTGHDAVTLALATDAPFSVDRETLDVGVGGAATVRVRFTPSGFDPADGSLRVDHGRGTLTLALTATTDPDADDDGALATGAGGDDCDDEDPDAYPGADDACYDGVDADCAGDDDDDCDGDGHPVGEDCDDGDAAVFPGATPDGANGVDDDCDGLVDEDALRRGDLVLTEIHPEAPAWIEVCAQSARDVPMTGFVLGTAAGDLVLGAVTVPAGGCVSVCRSRVAECSLQADLAVDRDEDAVTLRADALVLDEVLVTPDWPDDGGRAWSLDPARATPDLNDGPDGWCVTDGSPAAANEPCP